MPYSLGKKKQKKTMYLNPIKNVSILLFLMAVILGCDSMEDKKGRFLLKGNEKLKENDLQGAIEYYTEAVKLDTKFNDALLNRAIIYKRLNKLDLAIADYSKILENGSNLDTLIYFQRGLAYLDNGEYYKGLNDADQLLQMGKDNWKPFFLIGLIKEQLADLDGALAAFQQGLMINPNNNDLLVNKATIHYYQKDYIQAENLLDLAEKNDPNEANIYNLRSMIAFEKKNYQNAYDWVEKAISLNINEAYYYNNRGLYLLFLADLEKGLDDINFSIKKNPKNPFAWRNKGIYYYLKGDKKLALKYLGDALKANPKMDLAAFYYNQSIDL
jgi:tetratricopeptide (TPR) repeat protein